MTMARNSGWVAFCVRSGLMFLMLNKAKWHNQETEAEMFFHLMEIILAAQILHYTLAMCSTP